LLAALALAGSAGFAQEQEPRGDEPGRRGQERESVPFDDPPHAFEFALGGDGLALAYRNGLHRGKGYTSIGAFLSTDDDFVLHARLMRFGEPSADVPLGLGVGLGVFGARVEDPDDEVVAITLTGGADYALDHVLELTYPTRVGLELTWAPDVATFADGDRVLDVLGRVEVDLSTWATAFAGYRHLEVGLDDGGEELDSALQAGVRLGF
jgi:hypothetical protein